MSSRAIAITRAVSVIGGTTALIVAATFAAVSSNPVTISGISLASSDVQALNVYDFTGNSFTGDTSNPGNTGAINADLTTSTPGTQYPFYLQNTSGTSLNISATANPTASGSLDPSNVEVTFWDDSTGAPTQLGQGTLASMQAGTSVALNALAAGATGSSSSNVAGNYDVSFNLIAPDSSFDTLSTVQLIFTGTP